MPGLGEHARGELGLDGPARDERHAEAREHRAPHRLLQTELEAHVEIADPNAEPAKLVVDDPPHAGALLHDDERLARELVGADRLAREAMAGRAHEHDLVVGERLELDTAVARRGADDAELQLPFRDEVDHGPRVVHLERDADGRVRALELAEELRHDDRGGPGRGADREHAREVALRLRDDVGEHLLLEREEPLRAAVQAPSGLGRLDAAPRPVEELGAEPLLERPHLQRDGGLGDPEPLGRLGEGAALDDRAERCELTRIHKRSLSQSFARPGARGCA